jgi:hypothetical protein
MKSRLAFIVSLLVLANLAEAFKVSPVKLELSIPRGQTRDVVLTLNGTSGTSVENLIVYPTDLSISKTGVYTFQRNENSKFSAAPWVKFSDMKISLTETQKKELKFKISVPLNANPGEYYSILMIEPEKDTRMRSKEKPMAMDYKVRIGVVLILDVPGRIYQKTGKALSTEMIPVTPELIKQVKAEALGAKYDSKHELFYALTDFEKMANKTLILGSFQNLGNTHLYVSGAATIRSRDGRTSFGQAKLIAMGSEKDQVFAFPGDERYFYGVWDKPLPKGQYLCDALYDYGNKVAKAASSSGFSVLRDFQADESKNEFLSLEPKSLEMVVPSGALRTKVLKVSNTDNRPLNVSVTTSVPEVVVEPNSFTLQPGESKNVKATITISAYAKPVMDARVIFTPDRGLKSEIKLSLSEKSKSGARS